MKTHLSLPILVLSLALVAGVPRAASAQHVEVGGSLVSLLFDVGNNNSDNITVFGVPSASFGLLNPGVYGSFFLGTKAAIEPQVGVIVVSGAGETMHVFSGTAQFDYFFSGLTRRSAFAFASTGFTDASHSSDTPTSVGGGLGVRIPVGDRLTFRVDGRYLHFSDNGGDALSFGLSIGGVFGK